MTITDESRLANQNFKNYANLANLANFVKIPLIIPSFSCYHPHFIRRVSKVSIVFQILFCMQTDSNNRLAENSTGNIGKSSWLQRTIQQAVENNPAGCSKGCSRLNGIVSLVRQKHVRT